MSIFYAKRLAMNTLPCLGWVASRTSVSCPTTPSTCEYLLHWTWFEDGCSRASHSPTTLGDFKVGVSVGVYCTKCIHLLKTGCCWLHDPLHVAIKQKAVDNYMCRGFDSRSRLLYIVWTNLCFSLFISLYIVQATSIWPYSHGSVGRSCRAIYRI
jgi:hypothetical protein